LVYSTKGRTYIEVFGNSVLKRIFGSKWKKVVGGWRRLQNEELHNLYASQNISRVIKAGMRWVRHVARMGKDEKRIQYFGWKA
jgi:hypothetical protein